MLPYIDMHCDTLSRTLRLGRTAIEQDPRSMVDIERLRDAGVRAQFFAMFLLNDAVPENADRFFDRRLRSGEEQVDGMLNVFAETLKAYPDVLAPCRTFSDYLRNAADGKTSAILTVEDGYTVRSMENLAYLFDNGVRLITMTWNYENSLGFPNSSDPELMRKGLKPFGLEVVERMNELGILVDVSHLSDGGFYDVARVSKKPFVASHSCCRALASHQRNLTDEMIRILADLGGAIGINFCPPFLTDDGKLVSRVEDMCRHIEHMRQTGGEDVIAIGTDFDGIGGTLEVGSPVEMERLFDALKKRCGYTARLMDKFTCGNVERVLEACLPA